MEQTSGTTVFSARLKKAIKRSKLTQQELANLIGTSRQTVSNYIRGVREPPFATLVTIAEILDVTPDWLLGQSDEELVEEPAKWHTKNPNMRFLSSGDLLRFVYAIDNIEFQDSDYTSSIPTPVRDALVKYNALRKIEFPDNNAREALLSAWVEREASRLDKSVKKTRTSRNTA